MNRQQAEQVLKSTFGFEKFYDNQWTVIERILAGERVLLIEKTGFGKSLCFQFPATQFDGVTIVFSPLVALMRDQVQKLQALGIEAKFISYQHSDEDNQQTIEDAISGKLKILYIHPARMENFEWLENSRRLKIAMVVVDEAHCISTWGHDFIPSYRKIVNLVNLLPLNFPVLATTATATLQVEEDIKTQIGKNISSLRGNLIRPNLHLYVVKVNSEEEKMIWLGRNLEKIEGSGIIYCGTRVNTEIYTKWFDYLGIKSVHYNAGLDTDTKKAIEFGLMNNEYKCVVSTNALGMGIDKPDVRFIIHTQIPVSPVHYYQEIGRAGRDGLPAYIIVFYNPNHDSELPLSFIEGSRPPEDKYQKVINILKNERLGLYNLVRASNLTLTQAKVILSDLIAQGIIVEVSGGGRKFYEFKFDSAELNTKSFDELRELKLNDFGEMLHYLEIKNCRMKFLCDFLGDLHPDNCGVCDNCKQKPIKLNITQDWLEKIEDFEQTYFPVLEVESSRTQLINGVAGSYYGVSNVGQALHRCKYENGGEFPDWLFRLTIKAFYRHFGNEKFDVVIYVPPTESGELVKNFAENIASALNLNILHTLKKLKHTKPQKMLQSNVTKTENVKNVFVLENPNEIAGKSVLLIDDIYDSGVTIKEIGKYLSKLGAVKIAPLVIARTVGGDL